MSYFQQALEEAKNVAKNFSIYFESKLKNEARELATNVTTGYNFFLKPHLLIIPEITILVIVESSSAVCSQTSFIRNKVISNATFKSMQFFQYRNVI